MIPRITNELLKVENISITPHLTEECKKVIAQKTIESFNTFFDKIEQKERVVSFVKKHINSSRKTLRIEANNFIKKWSPEKISSLRGMFHHSRCNI
jgi:predicted house-cleaning noncanonical NTP pyrophosphatase (MazG superfamily)